MKTNCNKKLPHNMSYVETKTELKEIITLCNKIIENITDIILLTTDIAKKGIKKWI